MHLFFRALITTHIRCTRKAVDGGAVVYKISIILCCTNVQLPLDYASNKLLRIKIFQCLR